MLSVVVDDHDMGITHVIRGDDHLTNTFRQVQLYRACGWDTPSFSHIPLIHGPDGAKLSKRHGALGVEAYRDMGYLPEALRNYLARLSWSHGDDEIFSTAQAVDWFDIRDVGKSAARFDFVKLANLNAHYIKASDNAALTAAVAPRIAATLGRDLTDADRTLLTRAMDGLKPRVKTLAELADAALFFFRARPLALDEKAAALVAKHADIVSQLLPLTQGMADWTAAGIEAAVREFAEKSGVKLGDIAQPLRAALTGSTVSPPIFEVMELLGRDEVCGRIADLKPTPSA